ncbi:hypothetical protein N7488_002890, partial [Penicillium malachiteum]
MIDNLLLSTAIDTAPSKALRKIFKSICKDVPEARMHADKHLLLEKNNESASKTDASTIKPKVPRYVVCQNCHKDFGTDGNSSTACRYHPERFHEDIKIDKWDLDDSGVYREDLPDYFEFPCCKETLEANPHGCKYDWYVEGAAGTR